MAEIEIEFIQKDGADLTIQIGLGALVERPTLPSAEAFLPALMSGHGGLSVDQFCRVGAGEIVELNNEQVRRLALTFLACQGLDCDSGNVAAAVEEMARISAEKTQAQDSFSDWSSEWFNQCWPRRFSPPNSDYLTEREAARAEFTRRFRNRLERQKNEQ